jgi:hypothetical protein
MYKNFKLTESEKEQILKQHSNHGYKKPVNEQNELDNDEPRSNGGLVVDDNIFITIKTFYVDVFYEENRDPVTVTVSRGSKNEAYFEVAGYTVPEGQFAGDFINAVREKFTEDVFNNLPYDGVVLNVTNGKAEGY